MSGEGSLGDQFRACVHWRGERSRPDNQHSHLRLHQVAPKPRKCKAEAAVSDRDDMGVRLQPSEHHLIVGSVSERGPAIRVV